MQSLCGDSGPEKSKAMQEGTRVYTVKVNSLSKGHREWKIQERRLWAIEAVLHLWVASLNMQRSLFKLAVNQQSPNVCGGGGGLFRSGAEWLFRMVIPRAPWELYRRGPRGVSHGTDRQ